MKIGLRLIRYDLDILLLLKFFGVELTVFISSKQLFYDEFW